MLDSIFTFLAKAIELGLSIFQKKNEQPIVAVKTAKEQANLNDNIQEEIQNEDVDKIRKDLNS